jgi:hypothetical protein
MKIILQVIFYFNVPQNMLALVVDVGYESELFYNDISKDSINGGNLAFRFSLGGSWRKAIGLMENKDGIKYEYRNRTPSLIHCLFFEVHF